MSNGSDIGIAKHDLEKLATFFYDEYEKYANKITEEIEKKYPDVEVIAYDEINCFDFHYVGRKDALTKERREELSFQEFEGLRKEAMRSASAYMIIYALLEKDGYKNQKGHENLFEHVKSFYNAVDMYYLG